MNAYGFSVVLTHTHPHTHSHTQTHTYTHTHSRTYRMMYMIFYLILFCVCPRVMYVYNSCMKLLKISIFLVNSFCTMTFDINDLTSSSFSLSLSLSLSLTLSSPLPLSLTLSLVLYIYISLSLSFSICVYLLYIMLYTQILERTIYSDPRKIPTWTITLGKLPPWSYIPIYLPRGLVTSFIVLLR